MNRKKRLLDPERAAPSSRVLKLHFNTRSCPTDQENHNILGSN